MKIIALTLAALTGASARLSFGQCPTDLENVTNLDKSRYAGRWYQIEQDIQFPMTVSAVCTYKDLEINSTGDLDLWFGAYYTMMFQYSGAGGVMYCEDGNKETCEATMGGRPKRSDFPVLATDYETYEVNYICMNMVENFMKADFIMIWGREKEMSY